MHSPLPILAAACLTLVCLSASALEITVDGTTRHQVIRGFGTCLKSWGNPDKCPVVKWTLSERYVELYVHEMRMRVARIPIHKWVLEGSNPYKIPPTVTPAMIEDPTRITYEAYAWQNTGRAEAQPALTLRWMKLLRDACPEMYFIGSVWSPPHWMKQERPQPGKDKSFSWSKFGSESCGGQLNPKFATHYGHFLAEYVRGLKVVHGLDLRAVSIQNELEFYEPYDSCIYTPQQFADTLKAVGRVFKAKGLDTLLIGPEDMTKAPDRAIKHVIAAMKDPETAGYLGPICAHGYADGITTSLEAGDAARFWDLMQQHAPGREYWMTETGGGYGAWEPWERDMEQGKKKGQKVTHPGALASLGSMLHNAFTHGNASLWTNWQFLTESEDAQHALVHVTMESITPTKKFYIMKHYSRFIPAGSRRIAAGPDAQEEVTVSAYTHEEQQVLTIILTNHAEQERTVRLRLAGVPSVTSLHAHLTDASHDCAPQPAVGVGSDGISVVLPPCSLMTLSTLD